MTVGQQRVPEWFGPLIREERERRRWSLRELAGRSGVNFSSIQRIETGAGGALLSSAAALADALGLELSVTRKPCGNCHGAPPAGFLCPECERLGGAG